MITPAVIMSPLIIVMMEINSSRKIQAAKTVTNGSKYKNAPTLVASIDFKDCDHKTNETPEQNKPRNNTAIHPFNER